MLEIDHKTLDYWRLILPQNCLHVSGEFYKSLLHYRAVALKSHGMKALERLVLAQLRPHVKTLLDLPQFASQPNLDVDDAVIYMLQLICSWSVEEARWWSHSFICLLCFTFNTIQPLLLGQKLSVMGVNSSVISWITDYLTYRPQFVHLGSVLSDVGVGGKGAPQGTVLSPFLFTLYTSDFHCNSESCHLQTFSDN